MNEIEDIEDIFPSKSSSIENSWSEELIYHDINPSSSTNTLQEFRKKAKIFVKTWGCSHNTYDSEIMQAGFIISSFYEANVVILNSCTVKGPSEMSLFASLEEALSHNKKVIVAGCVPQSSKDKRLSNINCIGVDQIDRIVDVVELTLNDSHIKLMDRRNDKLDILQLPKKRKNMYIDIIVISTGCQNHCTFCKTKASRGSLSSYSIETLISKVTAISNNKNIKEIWITSEDTGAYGLDIGSNLPDLLRELVPIIHSNKRIRIGMCNPPYLLNYLTEIIKLLLNNKTIYKFLHIPVQSGSDKVLEDMKRSYTVNDFKYIVMTLRNVIPDIHIATDIITAFPSETIEDHQMTINLLSELKLQSVHITQFYPRPGTPAASMPLINGKEAKRRRKELTDLFHSYSPYSDRIGKKYNVVCCETSSDLKHLVCHNEYYDQILIPKKDYLLGENFPVLITGSSKFCMFGEVLEENQYSIGFEAKMRMKVEENLARLYTD